MRKHREVYVRLNKPLGDRLKGYCDRSGKKKWDLNWSSVGHGEEMNKVKEVMEEELSRLSD